MGMPKTVRLDDELENKLEKYLDANGIKFSQLVNLAVEKYISEPQTIELTPVASDAFKEQAKKAFKKHKNAMDKLK
jgi:antitoxin component of RelBE/YafQ-DinJ toxin-antitoxin module